jgi:hypothetical protein
MDMKRRKVKVHFNRINMQRGNPNVWTVHASGVCYQVASVQINVPVHTVYNPAGPQPRAFFSGFAHVDVRQDGVAVLY